MRDFLAEQYEERTVKVNVGLPKVAHDEGEYLQDWVTTHSAWETPARPQVQFMRDSFTNLLTGHYNGWVPEGAKIDRMRRVVDRMSDTDGFRNFDFNCMVVGEHTTKSVRLPVYSIRSLALGLEVRARNNFHDWKLSVLLRGGKPVTDTFGDLISREEDGTAKSISEHYCEGFTNDWVFGIPQPRDRPLPVGNNDVITLATPNNYTLWTIGYLIREARS